MSSPKTPFVSGSVSYEGDMGRHFGRGRALSAESIELWRQAVLRQLAGREVGTVLDVGAGSGRFSRLLSEWLGCEVLALEPSHTMRSQSPRGSRSPVRGIGGRAEAIPLADDTVDVAWLSQVIHHVRDRRAAALELFRTLRARGAVLLRGAFGDRLDGITLFEFFPEAREVAAAFPHFDEIRETFIAAGFELISLQRLRQQTCASLQEAAALTRYRADTTLQLISDRAFAEGQARIEAAAAVQSGPVWDEMDLVVFERRLI